MSDIKSQKPDQNSHLLNSDAKASLRTAITSVLLMMSVGNSSLVRANSIPIPAARGGTAQSHRRIGDAPADPLTQDCLTDMCYVQSQHIFYPATEITPLPPVPVPGPPPAPVPVPPPAPIPVPPPPPTPIPPVPRPPPVCYTPTLTPNAQPPDFNTVISNEGGVLQPYVPNQGMPINGATNNSGITIGAGIDLYGKTLSQLESYGFSTTIAQQLLPYTTQQGTTAQAYLTANPINFLTTAMLTEATNNALQQYSDGLASEYNSANPNGVPWAQLPSGATTPLVDLAYNSSTPTGFPSAAPSLWGDVTSNNWNAAYAELNNYAPNSPALNSRAQSDAALLSPDLTNGTLPPTDGESDCK